VKKRLFKNKVAELVFGMFAWSTVAIILGIFLMLSINGARLIFHISPAEFFNSHWNPSAYENPRFGIGSLFIGTMLTTLLAMVLAVPVGLATAGCLSELVPATVRNWIKPMIEMLAAVPSVVIGFLGVVVVGPFIAHIFHLPNGLNALNGAILLAIMALPTIVTIAEDAIHAVPQEYKEASYALGANPWTTLVKVTIPSCYSGLIAAVVLGLGRAIGETMTVLMVTGNSVATPHGIFDPVRTLTSTIAIEMGEVPFGSQHYYGLFACGLILFIFTLSTNILAEYLTRKLRKRGR
jgi:phosphate transport system permease protein